MIEIKKNAFTQIRIERREFQGKDFVDIRQYFKNDEDEYRPSQKGVTLPPDKLNELIQALQEINQ